MLCLMTAAASPPETATNAELIRRAFEFLNTHDVAALKQFWTAETVERFPTETSVGADAIGAYFQAAFDALPDFRIQIVGLAAQGDDVFAQWRMTGTHSGAPWQGIAPTGRAVALDGIDHFVVQDGKVTSNFVVFDQMQFARCVGLMPPDGSTVDRAMKAAFNGKTRIARRRKR
jgi:predicted ester cyclase